MSMKTSITVLSLALALAGGAAYWSERSRLATLLAENARLRAELEEHTARSATRASAIAPEELERLRAEAREVHRLRNETTQLRQRSNEVARLQTELQQLRGQAGSPAAAAAPAAAPASPGYFPKQDWVFSGYATPESAFQSAIWAMREGDTAAFLASLAPEDQEKYRRKWANQSEAEVAEQTRAQIAKLSAVRILEEHKVGDDEVVLRIHAEGSEDSVQKIPLIRVGNEWRLSRVAD